MTDLCTLAATETARIVAGVADDQLADRTPCAEFTVREALDHLRQAVEHIIDVLDGKDIDLSVRGEFSAGDWRGDFAAAAERMAKAFGDPSVPDGPLSNVGLTRSVLIELALSELLVHGWDLAVATAQDYRPHPDVVARVGRFHDGGPNKVEPQGSFGAPVPVAADAALLDRTLGGLGRNPDWKP